MIFIRLLHLLAHHPDFAKTSETLEETAKFVSLSRNAYSLRSLLSFRYIQFYLGIIGSADNVSLLYHLALKAKTVRDAESHTYSEVNFISTPQRPSV
jgi:sister-chromatid-cohesion protein PDS5